MLPNKRKETCCLPFFLLDLDTRIFKEHCEVIAKQFYYIHVNFFFGNHKKIIIVSFFHNSYVYVKIMKYQGTHNCFKNKFGTHDVKFERTHNS